MIWSAAASVGVGTLRHIFADMHIVLRLAFATMNVLQCDSEGGGSEKGDKFQMISKGNIQGGRWIN